MLRAGALGPLGQLALVTLRAVQRGGLRAALGDLIPLVRALSSVHDGPEALTVLLRYLVTVVPAPEQPAVQALVAALPSHEEEEAVKKVKTIAEAWLEEGAARARAEIEERVRETETRVRAETETRAREATIAKQLRLKFGPLPDAVCERLARATADELDGIAERLLFASTLDGALGDG